MTARRRRRSRALGALLAAVVVAAAPTAGAQDADATPLRQATAPGSGCAVLSPIAAPCTLRGKFADAVSAACRNAGVPDTQCTLPLAHRVTEAARTAYLQSATHRTVQFQSRLGDALPLGQAPWLGTHNSFDSIGDAPTLSRSDSNEQLSLTQQLDVDMRALELDLHYLPRPAAPGGREVVVCHGQGPQELDVGGTTEPPFTSVLPQVTGCLNAPAHQDQVLLLYLEDELGNAAAYASTVATLDAQLRRPDGSSLICRPAPSARAANGCTPLPLGVTRAQVRASGARVILVGRCATGWASDVFAWNAVHVESGSAARYRPYPACDASYDRAVYRTKLVRYYEDSTLVATLVDPTRAPVAAMTSCGVGLFGFDQLLPDDERIAASVWSWADGQPSAATGACALQRGDGRWVSAACAARHRAACVRPRRVPGWTLTRHAVRFAQAVRACRARGARFAVPRSGLQNQQLRQVARAGEPVWLAHRDRPATG